MARTQPDPWTRYTVSPDGCWEWGGTISGQGYGRVYINRRQMFAHRAFYEHFVGPIPEGLELDHLCRVRHCVNPAHLEPVTHRANILRSPTAPPALRAVAEECIHGHPFDEQNTYWRPDGDRDCKACRAQVQRVLRARRKAEAGIVGSQHNRDKTHCKRGHEFTPENTYMMKSGGRKCLACAVLYRAKR